MGKLPSLDQNSYIRELFGKLKILIGHSKGLMLWVGEHSECSFGKSMLNAQLRYSEKLLLCSVKSCVRRGKESRKAESMIRGREELLLLRSNCKTSYESSFKGDVTGLQSHEGHDANGQGATFAPLQCEIWRQSNKVRTQFKMNKEEDLVLHTTGCRSVQLPEKGSQWMQHSFTGLKEDWVNGGSINWWL